MDQLINQNLAEREQTRAALTHKLEVLESRLRESIEDVRQAIRRSTDVSYQVGKRPWWTFGLSVLLGCVLGRMLSGGAKIPTRQIGKNNIAPDQYTQRVGVIKGATIGTMASVISELARHVIPAIVRRLESSWQDKSTEGDMRKHGSNVSALRR
jgi:ElaB/YqjD/DUF883 family membrane-anchored ribosome-binding protein